MCSASACDIPSAPPVRWEGGMFLRPVAEREVIGVRFDDLVQDSRRMGSDVGATRSHGEFMEHAQHYMAQEF